MKECCGSDHFYNKQEEKLFELIYVLNYKGFSFILCQPSKKLKLKNEKIKI